MKLKLASMDDFEFFFEIKSENYNLLWTGHEKIPDKNKLKDFFEKHVKNMDLNDTRKIYIILNEGIKIGYGYLDPYGEDCKWSVAIKEKFCGKGYGKKSLNLAILEAKKMNFQNMIAFVREDNIASLSMFLSCGFQRSLEYKDMYISQKKETVKMYKLTKKL